MKFRAPVRIDFLGGTLDLWPLHHILGGASTFNAAVDLYAEVDIEATNTPQFRLFSEDLNQGIDLEWSELQTTPMLPLICETLRHLWTDKGRGVSIRTRSGSPPGAGLGGSSTMLVTLATAIYTFLGKDIPGDHELVEIVHNIEAKIIRAPTGVQDYWSALRGGFNDISFFVDRTQVRTQEVDPSWNEQLVLIYSGQSRASALNNIEVFYRTCIGQEPLFQEISQMADLSRRARNLESKEFLSIARDEWTLRSRLWPTIHTLLTKQIEESCFKAGASLVRVCGAGGGGVMFAMGPNPDQMAAAATSLGAKILSAKFVNTGVERCA